MSISLPNTLSDNPQKWFTHSHNLSAEAIDRRKGVIFQKIADIVLDKRKTDLCWKLYHGEHKARLLYLIPLV